MLGQPFSIPAISLAVLSVPLILGLVPPNRIYGIRPPQTIADRKSWYHINRFGGWALLIASAFYLLIAALVPNPPPPHDSALRWLIHVGAFAGPLFASLLLIRSAIRRL